MASHMTSRNDRIDAALRHAVEAGDVPGVVAMATDKTSVIYEGAFGKRIQGQPAPMTVDTAVFALAVSAVSPDLGSQRFQRAAAAGAAGLGQGQSTSKAEEYT